MSSPGSRAPEELWSHWSDVEALASLIQRHPDWVPHLGEPLRDAAAAGALDAVRCFLDHGAEVNNANDDGERALGFACAYDHVAVARLLVERGAEFEYLDAAGGKPLDTACCGGSLVLREWLISLGATRALDFEPWPSNDSAHAGCSPYCVEKPRPI